MDTAENKTLTMNEYHELSTSPRHPDATTTEPVVVATYYPPEAANNGHEQSCEAERDGDHEKSGRKYTSKPPDYFILAVLVTVLCNLPLGGAGVLFAYLSKRDYHAGLVADARTKGRVAKWLSILGIAFTFVLALFIMVYFVFIKPNIVNSPEDLLTL
jgi:hypothetical protein